MPLIGTVVVSTTTSGSTTISCEEYCVGSSDIVVSDISDGILGYVLLPDRLGPPDFFLGFGEGSGDGVGILSPSSFGRTYVDKVNNTVVTIENAIKCQLSSVRTII